ncbi:hypothetical protein EON64_16420 [archaeon]|nr:MAG: hypothetical protein EON64_16420 [archaeon]
MSELKTVFNEFRQKNADEFVNGTLKICIGGGAGFIGSHLAKSLKEEVGLCMSVIFFAVL